MSARSGCIGIFLLAAICPFAQAQVVVPANASFALNGGSLDLAGTGLQVAGAFSLGAGNVDNVANVAIASGGGLDGGGGAITLSGDWSNAGTFTAGSGSVNFADGGVALSNVSGNTTFGNLSFISNVGKPYSFAVGSTQTIGGLLTILGTSTQGIQFKSAAAGQVAFIDLLNGGSQNIDFVGVSDVHATGQQLAPTKTNDGGTGNATGWFGINGGGGGGGGGGGVAATPMLSTLAMLLMAMLLTLSAAFLFHPATRRR